MSESNVQDVMLEEIETEKLGKSVIKSNPLELVKDVKVQLAISLGEAHASVGELMALKEKSVLPLDRMLNDPVDILLNGNVVARGNLVAVGDHFGIQITELNMN